VLLLYVFIVKKEINVWALKDMLAFIF